MSQARGEPSFKKIVSGLYDVYVVGLGHLGRVERRTKQGTTLWYATPAGGEEAARGPVQGGWLMRAEAALSLL